jgi:alpha-tubulin suppressor-like RCC1 family protein
MGNGQVFEIDVPPVVVSQQAGVGAIATGGGHTCLLRTDAALRCWGSGQFGQLGVGDMNGRTTPTNVPDAVGWAAP